MMQDDLKNHLRRLERRLVVSYTIALIALIGLSIVSNYVMKDQAAHQVTSLIRRNAVHDPREALYQLSEAELEHFDGVVYFNQDSVKLYSLPSSLDPEEAIHPDFKNAVLNSRIETTMYFDEHEKHKVGSVLFIFSRFSQAPWAFLVWILFVVGTIPIIRSSRNNLVENYKRDVSLREESTRADLARRVRHDIRSPLGALQIATQDLSGLTERQAKLITQATKRISEIVSELQLIRVSLPVSMAVTTGALEVHSVMSAVEDIIQEKRIQLAFSKISIVPNLASDSFFLFAKFHPAEFKRTLSNILTNAIEACDERDEIVVSLIREGEKIIIEIKDNGRGIAPEIMARVAEKGFTSKLDGSGLGLYYAQKMTDEIGGTLSIDSENKRGTKVQIALPGCPPPVWHTPKIEIPKGATVVVLDDQESSRLALKMRLDEMTAAGAPFDVVTFGRAEDFRLWHLSKVNSGSELIYLFDYDLGKNQPTGLDLIQELKLTTRVYLVTGHYDASDVQTRCNLLKVGLVPKTTVATLPFLSA